MIKAVLFDVDGVIYDDNKELIDFHKQTAKTLDLRIPSDTEIYKHFGKSWNEIIDTLWPGIDKGKFRKKYLEILNAANFLPKFNGDVKGTIEFLRTKYKIGLVSGGIKERIETKLKNHDIYHFFDVIIAADDTERHKPFGDPVLKACEELKVKPDEVVYIGDNITDYEAAKAAKILFVGFIWKGLNDFFEDLKLKNSVDKFENIPKEIEKIEAEL